MLVLMLVFLPLPFYPPVPVILLLQGLHVRSPALHCSASGDFISSQELPVPGGLHPATKPYL